MSFRALTIGAILIVAVLASLAATLLPHYLTSRPPGDASLEAWRHYSGVYGQIDYVSAHAVLEQAVSKGDPVAEMTFAELSRYFDDTYELPAGFEERVERKVQELAGQGEPAAIFTLASFMETFQLEDEVSYFSQMLAAAGSGYEPAFYLVGYGYAYGQGTEPDPEMATRWLRQAAALGDSSALYVLGYLLCQEDWPEHDCQEGVELLKDAADRGYADAFAAVGYSYRKGIGVEADLAQAVDWYRRGAEIGEPSALYSLGYCYQHGLGVEENSRVARGYIQQAANAGSVQALKALEILEGESGADDPGS